MAFPLLPSDHVSLDRGPSLAQINVMPDDRHELITHIERLPVLLRAEHDPERKVVLADVVRYLEEKLLQVARGSGRNARRLLLGDVFNLCGYAPLPFRHGGIQLYQSLIHIPHVATGPGHIVLPFADLPAQVLCIVLHRPTARTVLSVNARG
jgi:hypothetical protein